MHMGRETIAVDIDEVLLPFVREFLVWYNPRNGTTFAPEQFHTYRFEDITGRSVPDTMKDIYDFCAIPNLHIEPLDEAQAAIAELNKRFDLALLTARHPDYKSPTELWVEQHFRGMFKSLDMIGYELVMEKPRTKAEVCKELGAFMLIDDSLQNVTECARQGIEGVLFGNYPWNQAEELPEDVTRCEDWLAVLEHIDVTTR